MTKYKVLQLLFLVSSMASQALIKGMVPKKKRIEEGSAQRIEELPKELRHDTFPSALALRESPKYEIYKKFDVGYPVLGIVLTKDNTKALIRSKDVAAIWDVKKGKLFKELLKGPIKHISSMALSADGTLALTGSIDDGTARVWNMNTGKLLKTIRVGSRVNSVALNADGTLALTGGQDGTARVWNTSTGKLLKTLQVGSRVNSVALSADGAIALTGSQDNTIRAWDIPKRKSVILQAGSPFNAVALSADGTIALTRTTDKKVLVWDVKTGALLNTLLPNSPFIYSIALSKDGKKALVVTDDNNIQVWNTKPLPGQKETSTPLTVLEGHRALEGYRGLVKVAFGGADFIASGSFDKTVIIWKPFALKPRGLQENIEVLWQAYEDFC